MRDNVSALCEACYDSRSTTYEKCYDGLSDEANDIIAANKDVQEQFQNAYDTVCTEYADCSNDTLANERVKLVLNEVCKHHREEVLVAANNVAVGRQLLEVGRDRQGSYPIESADFPGEEEGCAYCGDREYFVLGILIGMVAMYAILHFNLHSKVIKMIRRR